MSATQTPQKNTGRWRRLALEAAIFLALLFAFQLWQLRDTARGPAPDFGGQRIDGSAFNLQAWRAEHPGQAVLLYFWADWCPICKTTAGSVSSIAEDWPVTSIAVQSGTPEAIAAYMREHGYGWPTLPDPQGTLLRRYGLPGTPAFVIVAPNGDIRFVTAGYTAEIGLRLRLWWASRAN